MSPLLELRTRRSPPPPSSTLFPYTTLFRSVRGGWAMAYQRPGMSDFTGVFGDNQGIAVSLQRDQNNATLPILDRKSTRLNSSHLVISYAVFCLKKKKTRNTRCTFGPCT